MKNTLARFVILTFLCAPALASAGNPSLSKVDFEKLAPPASKVEPSERVKQFQALSAYNGFHQYTVKSPLCDSAANHKCNAEMVKKVLSRYAFPCQNHSQPIVDMDRSALPKEPHLCNAPTKVGTFGHVQTTSHDGGMTLMNDALPDHWLRYGVVVRAIKQSGTTFSLETYGVGVNTNNLVAMANKTGAQAGWVVVDKEIKGVIDACLAGKGTCY
jgi:hypothetical protein